MARTEPMMRPRKSHGKSIAITRGAGGGGVCACEIKTAVVLTIYRQKISHVRSVLRDQTSHISFVASSQSEEALWTSTELLGQRNDNAFETTNVTEEVFVFVLHYLSDKFSTMGLQPGQHVFDILNGEHDATDT